VRSWVDSLTKWDTTNGVPLLQHLPLAAASLEAGATEKIPGTLSDLKWASDTLRKHAGVL